MKNITQKSLKVLSFILLSKYLFAGLAIAGQITGANGGFYNVRNISIAAPGNLLPGNSAVAVGDIDGDGITDYLITSTSSSPSSPISAISGFDGNVLWESTLADEFVSVMDDVNSDGEGDILCKKDADVLILDFLTGSVIHSWTYASGVNVVEVGDADSDGINDVCVWPTATGLEVNSTAVGGTQIWNYPTSDHISVVSDIDADQDGLNDIILGLGDHSSNGFTANGKILSLDGEDGTVLSEIEGLADDANAGYYIRSIPDIDGDGVSEIFCLNGNIEYAWYGGYDPIGVEAFSVVFPMTSRWSNQVIFNGGVEEHIAVVPMGDSNSDGVSELCIALPTYAQYSAGFSYYRFYSLDGNSGTMLHSSNEAQYGGHNWELIGDCNGDGLSEIAAAGWESGQNGPATRVGVIDVVDSDNSWEINSWYSSVQDMTGYGLQVYDLNDDGVLDIITGFKDRLTLEMGLRFYDSKTGELLAKDYLLGITPPNSWDDAQMELISHGDEIVIFTGEDLGGFQKMTIMDKTLAPGMTSSATMLSRGQVSRVEFDLDFNDSASYYLYTFLMSRVAGTTMIRDLSVPLGYDSWLVKSYLGMLPGVFNNATGMLNSNGVSKVVLQLPANAIPASLVGTSLYFAAITKLAWAPQWDFSSVVNEVLITP